MIVNQCRCVEVLTNFHRSPPKGVGIGQPPLGPRTTSNPPEVPGSRPTLKPLSTEGSIIPGETEEDGLLRREYVLVGDTQAVEFNRAVDGAHFTLPKLPLLNLG